MKDMKKKYPDIRLNTSIIVGFPTKTEQDFSKSMELLDGMLFDEADLYKYEERANSPSLRLCGRVPSRVKETRLKRMRRKTISDNFKKMVRMQVISLVQSLIQNAILFAAQHKRATCSHQQS